MPAHLGSSGVTVCDQLHVYGPGLLVGVVLSVPQVSHFNFILKCTLFVCRRVHLP